MAAIPVCNATTVPPANSNHPISPTLKYEQLLQNNHFVTMCPVIIATQSFATMCPVIITFLPMGASFSIALVTVASPMENMFNLG
jgi:hypothetical protein